MSIDIDEMVKMAREREGWAAKDDFWVHDPQLPDGKDGVATSLDGHTGFIAQSPRAILALSERVATLETQNAALQARVEALGEWQGVEVVPELTGNGWGVSCTPRLEILVKTTGRMERLTDFSEDKPTWLYKWSGDVVGWRPLPDEPPTAV